MMPPVTLIRRTSSDMVPKESGHVVGPIVEVPVVRTAFPYTQGLTQPLLPKDEGCIHDAEVVTMFENSFIWPIAVVERATAIPSHVWWGRQRGIPSDDPTVLCLGRVSRIQHERHVKPRCGALCGSKNCNPHVLFVSGSPGLTERRLIVNVPIRRANVPKTLRMHRNAH